MRVTTSMIVLSAARVGTHGSALPRCRVGVSCPAAKVGYANASNHGTLGTLALAFGLALPA